MNISGRTSLARTGVSKGMGRQPDDGWEYLRSVFQDSPEGVCVVDRSMRVAVWNRTATEITGYEASEVLGRNCRVEGNNLKLESFSRAEGLVVRGVHRDGSPSPWASYIRKKSGDGTWLNVPAAVIPLRHRDLAFLIHFVRRTSFPMEFPYNTDSLINQHSARLARWGSTGNQEPTCSALTRREQEILLLIAAGKTAKPIATELSLSLSTVRTHIQNLLRKLKVHSCLEAAVWLLSRA